MEIEQEEFPPLLLYRNLVARNVRDPLRIAIEPPSPTTLRGVQRIDVSSKLESLVALRIVPNYTQPFAPVLFFGVADAQIIVCSFGDGATPLTAEQASALEQYDAVKASLVPLQLEGLPSACRSLLLVKHVLERLQSPTSQRELMFLLQQAAAPYGEQLRLQCQTRFDVLDQAWLWAIKWSRLAHPRADMKQPENRRRAQVRAARDLYMHVKTTYQQRLTAEQNNEKNVQAFTERTLYNMMRDYRYYESGK